MANLMDMAARILVMLGGAWLVLWTINQALRSFVLPRSDRAFLTANTFKLVYKLFSLRFKPETPFLVKDRALAMLSPVTMFLLPLVWLALIAIGYTGIYWAISPELDVRQAFILSGSSLMTLGFAYQDEIPIIILSFSQAALSMMLIALLIGYLPTMYSAFTQRETMVTKLEVYAGSPPSPVEMIRRLDYTRLLYSESDMRELWFGWQDWFVQLEENHTTLAPMNFYRSVQPDRHWVTAAGAILDTAAIIASSVRIEHSLQGGIVIRSGFLALRAIADYFRLPYDPDPAPTDPIHISREEFEAALDGLAASGIPLREDRDYCWEHFAGWRVNYDEVLLGLARITTAPYAPWSSDRAFEWREEDIPDMPASILESIRARRVSEEEAQAGWVTDGRGDGD